VLCPDCVKVRPDQTISWSFGLAFGLLLELSAHKEKSLNLQSAMHFLYPPQCLSCGEETSADFALCAECWREAAFINGLVCDVCGIPLPGEPLSEEAEEHPFCDDCLARPKPWDRGRAALLYQGTARRMVMGLKHRDRQELASPMAMWLKQAGQGLFSSDTLVAPVPLHRHRFFTRRFNQSALLAAQFAKLCNLSHCPDLLKRHKATRIQESMTLPERYENLSQAISVPSGHLAQISRRPILLIDDVMTSGATLSACAEACKSADAAEVNVLVLARVARDT